MGTPSSEFEIIQNTLSKSDNRLIVSSLCEITGVSRSGYYNWLKSEETRRKRDEQDKNDFELILACPIRKAKPYRRMLKAMRTSHIAENLLNRDFTGLGARKVLLTDITYIPCNGVFFYLSTILDAFTRQVLAYVLSDSLEVDFVLETVNRLLEQHRIFLSTETLIHSDQGCHYTSCRFIQIVKDAQLRQSMSRRGNCRDNAPQESFFGHMKDLIDLTDNLSFGEVKAVIDDHMSYYNSERHQ